MGDVSGTYGALIAGSLVSMALTGVVITQSFIYVRLYRKDAIWLKGLVASVWLVDLLHAIFICVSLWDYLIAHMGDQSRIDFVPWSIALTVALTAIMTFIVQAFYTMRIYKLSKGNLWISGIIGSLTVARVVSACVTTKNLIKAQYFSTFLASDGGTAVFTLGLSLSLFTEMLISASMVFYLEKNRPLVKTMNTVIDTLIIYTLKTGTLTCVVTLVSLITWLTMPHNLIFFAIHFIITKLYANSLLVVLNARAKLRMVHYHSTAAEDGGQPLPVVFPTMASDNSGQNFRGTVRFSKVPSYNQQLAMQVTVTTTVDQVVDCEDCIVNCSHRGTPTPSEIGSIQLHAPDPARCAV